MQRTIERLENGNLKVTVKFCFRNRCNNRKIIVADGEDGVGTTIDTMMQAIARGRRWQQYIDEGRFRNGTELAHALGREAGKVAWTMRLAMLAPDIIHRILVGDIPKGSRLRRCAARYPTSGASSANCTLARSRRNNTCPTAVSHASGWRLFFVL